jgi:hypothetical protein
MDVLRALKQELWKCFSSMTYPSEWDGNVCGGGKLSQRYWEYLKTIEYLGLNKESIVLDIGGGSCGTGCCFFAAVIRQYVKKVIVMDPKITLTNNIENNIEYVCEKANYDSLKNLFLNHKITHISCISVFEHIALNIRDGIIRAINTHFQGEDFVATFEYHPKKTFFEYQLTAKSISRLFSNLSNFYLEDYSMSPVLSENAFFNKRHFLFTKKFISRIVTPRWYPLAVKFSKINDL